MKYDEKIYFLSELLNQREEKDSPDKEIKEKQKRLLELIFAKYCKLIESGENLDEDLLRINFEQRFYQNPEKGYDEVDDLYRSNNLDSFLREYCMYLGDCEFRCDEFYTAYYEIVWDHKAYYEQANNKYGPALEMRRRGER